MISTNTAFEEPPVRREFDWTCKFCGKTFHKVETISAFLADIISMKPTVCDRCGEEKKAKDAAEAARNAWRTNARKAGVPEMFLDYDSRKGNSQLLEWVKQHWNGSMFLTGQYDTCKSRTLAYAVTRWLIAEPEMPVRYYNWYDLCEKYVALTASGLHEAEVFKRNLLQSKILLVDDFGKRRITPIVEDLAYGIVNGFYESGNRLWLTSNRSLAELTGRFDNQDIAEAVISRIDRMIRSGTMAHWSDRKTN